MYILATMMATVLLGYLTGPRMAFAGASNPQCCSEAGCECCALCEIDDVDSALECADESAFDSGLDSDLATQQNPSCCELGSVPAFPLACCSECKCKPRVPTHTQTHRSWPSLRLSGINLYRSSQESFNQLLLDSLCVPKRARSITPPHVIESCQREARIERPILGVWTT